MPSSWFRWLVVPLVCVAAFYAVFIAGFLSYVRMTKWCPWGFDIAGDAPYCRVPDWANSLMVSAFGSVAAALVVWVGTRTAPLQAAWVPWVIYAAGAIVTIVMTIDVAGSAFPRTISHVLITDVVPAISALAFGAVTAQLCTRRAKHGAG